MRVALHVGQLHQKVPGGIGRYVRSLLATLPAVGVDVEPFGSVRWPSVRYELWHRSRRPAVRTPGDVVHATSLAVPPPGARPLVVTVHDLVFLHQPEHLTARGVAFHRRGLDLARRDAAAIVVPSEFGKRDLVDHGFDPARIHVAHHGVDVVPGDAVPREDFALFVGTIEPRKGVGDLLAACQRIDRRLVVAGPAGWGDVPGLDAARVEVLGDVDDARLADLYRRAAVLALPSRYEGFGLPVLEAMAYGCPVVVSDAACLPEVVGDAGAIVPVGDIDALAAALASPPDGGPGRERAKAFTWRRSAEAHRAAYEAAVEP